MSRGECVFFLCLAYTKPGDRMIDTIWQNEFEMPQFPRLSQDLKTDVLIIGGGMAGILCAHRLAAAGIEYALIEADRICCGVTRNTTAKITSQHGLIYGQLIRMHGKQTARMYWQANEAALEEYRKLATSVACDFQNADSYIYAANDLQALIKEKEALDSLEIPSELVQQIGLPVPVKGAIRFQNQAQFHPLKFAAELAKGLHIYEHTAAREWKGNKVTTDHGTITASKIIVATHFPLFNKHGAYFLKMYQQRSYVLALENVPKVDGMYLDAAQNGLSFRNWGDFLLLGGGGHRTGKQGGGWTALENFVNNHYPNAREVCRWATQDCMSLDGMPYIGRYGKHSPNLFVATGFNKWGMTSSMVAAMVLCDLVQGKENPYAQVFRPDRTIFRKQLLCNGVETTVNLLTPTKPRCPHLGCALKWNRQEHSWDCPCHGSRFSEDGKLLDNPATGDLKQKDL